MEKVNDINILLEQIKRLEPLPVNYRYLKVVISEAAPGEHVDIIKTISVDTYKTDFYKASIHHKTISKIIDYTPLIEKL